MPQTLGSRLQHAWNAFFNKDPTETIKLDYGSVSVARPDRLRMSYSNKRSIVAAIYNRIAVDASMIPLEHVKVDENGRYQETVDSGLNNALTTEANVDQSGKDFIRDVIMSMFDEGCVAIAITEATADPTLSATYDIGSLRVAKITQWYPRYVKVNIYNDMTGNHVDKIYPKSAIAIVENPFYAIMNEPNSVLQQLIRKLNLLNYIEQQSNYGKLDLIIQLPYVVRSPTRKKQAQQRRTEIEDQLANSKYGIAYTDGTERITQLNRPVENNLWNEVQDLTSMLYNQLGLQESIFNGTADEQAMINYYSRSIDPVLAAIADAIQRTFLSKIARTKGQAIRYFRNPFGLVPAKDLAEIGDKFINNEILSSNEMRAELGYKPSDDPRANELRNRNINPQEGEVPNNLQEIEEEEQT